MAIPAEIVITTNVEKSLGDFAKKTKVSIDSLSFDIIGLATYYKKHPSTKWIALDEKTKKLIMQTKYLAAENIYFNEQYKIKIFQKDNQDIVCHPDFSIVPNESKSQLSLILKKDSQCTLTKASLQEFVQEIKRRQVLSHYFIGLFNLDLKIVLQPMIAAFREHKNLPEDLKIIISKALSPDLNIGKTIVSHYLQKEEDQRTAYEKGVDTDELILEYYFPQLALGGRSCQGNYINPLGPKITNCELIFYDETIKSEVNEQSITYYALKSGYVDFEDNKLRISNSLSLAGAAFKTTGSITVGGHRDIDLKITSNDEFEDAIDKGVHIDVSNIDVKGSVAGNTMLQAQTVNIGAQTHKTTKIIAEESASVYLHRGDLKTKDANISKLEHGLVEADTVKIGELLGGEIRAKQVKVDILYSNTRIFASESIELGKINGSRNKLIIAPDRIENQEEAILKLEKGIETLRRELFDAEKNLDTRRKQFEANYSRIDHFKEQVAKATQTGMPPPKTASIKVKQYTLDKHRLDDISNELPNLRLKIENALSALDKYQNIIMYAKILYPGIWDGHQEIYYVHVGGEIIEKYTPEGSFSEIMYSQIPEDKLIYVNSID